MNANSAITFSYRYSFRVFAKIEIIIRNYNGFIDTVEKLNTLKSFQCCSQYMTGHFRRMIIQGCYAVSQNQDDGSLTMTF